MIRIIAACSWIVISFGAVSDESMIRAYLDKHQPDGWGPGFVIDTELGNLHGEVDTLVVLYTYTIGSEQDRNHWQYLGAFDPRGGTTYKPTRWLLVGGGGQYFEKIKIENQFITLSGMKHMPGDNACCPSAKTSVEFIYTNGQLVARGR